VAPWHSAIFYPVRETHQAVFLYYALGLRPTVSVHIRYFDNSMQWSETVVGLLEDH
jgi:hypothetical protein